MAAVEGRDFALAEKTAYTGKMGVGKGCLVGTRNLLLQLPVRTGVGRGRAMDTRDWTISGEPVVKYLRDRLNDPDLDSSGVDSELRRIASEAQGGEIVDLSVVRRLKVRLSLLSKGLYISEKSSGPGWRAFPLSKSDARKFQEFYQGHPAAVGS